MPQVHFEMMKKPDINLHFRNIMSPKNSVNQQFSCFFMLHEIFQFRKGIDGQFSITNRHYVITTLANIYSMLIYDCLNQLNRKGAI